MDILPPKPQQPTPTPPEPKNDDGQGTKISVNISGSGTNTESPALADASSSVAFNDSVDEPTPIIKEDINASSPQESSPTTDSSVEKISFVDDSPAPASSAAPESPQNQNTMGSVSTFSNSTAPSAQPSPQPVSAQQQVPTPQNANEMQNPKVFDTNQYHVPIAQDKKHNPAMHMLLFAVVFILVLVVGGLVAIDAELIDLGFDAPFDLIK